jgi:hypothetical protein
VLSASGKPQGNEAARRRKIHNPQFSNDDGLLPMVSGRPPGKRSRSDAKHRRKVGRTPLRLGERLIEGVDRTEIAALTASGVADELPFYLIWSASKMLRLSIGQLIARIGSYRAARCRIGRSPSRNRW